MPDLAWDYLSKAQGNVEDYCKRLATGQRLGQAFFNSLSNEDKERLRARPEDPFNYNDSTKVAVAIRYLIKSRTGL